MTLSLVQSNQFSPTATTLTATVTLGAGVTLGNLLVVDFGDGNNATTLTAPTGWTQATINQPAGASATIETSIWYILVAAGQVGQTSWIFTGSASHSMYLCIEEWNSTTGWQASPLDKVAAGDTIATPVTATTISSGTTATTTQAVELWIAALAYKNSAQTESSITAGWTKDQESTFAANNTMTMLHNIASSTGTAACSYVIGTAEFWAGSVATFKPMNVTVATLVDVALTPSDSVLKVLTSITADDIGSAGTAVTSTDTFAGRTVAAGSWGTSSDNLNVWQGALSAYSVSSGEGQFLNNATFPTNIYGTNSYTDVGMLFRFTLGATPDQVFAIMRQNSDSVAVIVSNTDMHFEVWTNGTNHSIAGPAFTCTPGTFYWFRAQVIDHTLYGKSWQDGSGEPGPWTAIAMFNNAAINMQPGTIGIKLFSSSATLPVKVDNFTVTNLGGPASDALVSTETLSVTENLTTTESSARTLAYLPNDDISLNASFPGPYDTFAGRTVGAGSWGTASDSVDVWQLSSSGFSVSSSEGRVLNSTYLTNILSTQHFTDVEMLCRFTLGQAGDLLALDVRDNIL